MPSTQAPPKRSQKSKDQNGGENGGAVGSALHRPKDENVAFLGRGRTGFFLLLVMPKSQSHGVATPALGQAVLPQELR